MFVFRANISLASFAPFPFLSPSSSWAPAADAACQTAPPGTGSKICRTSSLRRAAPAAPGMHRYFLDRCPFWTMVTCCGILYGVQLKLDYKYKHWLLACCCYQNILLTALESGCCSVYEVKILYGIAAATFTLVGHVGAIYSMRFEVHSLVLLKSYFSWDVMLCHWVCRCSQCLDLQGQLAQYTTSHPRIIESQVCCVCSVFITVCAEVITVFKIMCYMVFVHYLVS